MQPWLRELFSAWKIKLSGGTVGRVCAVLIAVSLSIAGVGMRTSNDWVAGGAIAAIFLLALVILSKAMSFAEHNPGVALLDGAQLIRHEQLRVAAKGSPEFTVVPETQKERRPVLMAPEEASAPDAPQIEPSESD